ncbi:MAG: hypothetical protein RML34_01655 [Leptospiraceae bacterium]|nr:hypothetical protein [Leptospiraceae bacterium]
MSFFIYLGLFLVLMTSNSFAICGGEYCPVRVKKSEEIQYAQTNFYEGFGVGTQYRTVAFDIGGKGYYNALIFQPMYFHPRFSAGTILPLVQLYEPGVKNPHYGIANPLLLAEYYPLNKETMLALGTMAELPLGNHERGMAADHFMLIPYITLTQAVLRGYAGAQLAYQRALHGHDHGHHHHRILYVNPHEDEEIWYRVYGGWRFGSYTPELLISGRYALEQHLGQDRSFLSIGTIQRYRLSPGLELNINLEFPVLSREREFFRVGGGVYAQLADLLPRKHTTQNNIPDGGIK